jgi:hypothetical protein
MKSHALAAAIKPYIKDANSALAKCKGTAEVKSTRGWRTMDSPAVVRSAYPQGKEIEEAAFMSTTESTALSFFDGPVSLTVWGKSGVNVKEFSCAGAENERLYPSGSRFNVETINEDATLVKAWLDWQKTPPAGPKPTAPAFTVTLREP